MSLILALTISAHAGLREWCARVLVADDPAQFESAPDQWLERERDRLRIKAAWAKATPQDLRTLEIIEATIRLKNMARKMHNQSGD